MNRQKILIILALVAFLFCYLAWGGNHAMFVFQMEYHILFDRHHATSNFSHPFILLPFIGQLSLLVSVFFKRPHRWVILAALALLSTLVAMILLTGILSANFRVLGSTLPFIFLCILLLRRKRGR